MAINSVSTQAEGTGVTGKHFLSHMNEMAHLDSARHLPVMEEAALLVAGVVWARVNVHRVQKLAHRPHRRLQRSTSTSFSRKGA